MSARVVSTQQFGHLFNPDKSGFSVNMQTGESPTSGYMVAQSGSERSFSAPLMHPEHLHQYATDYAAQLGGSDRYFGGWNDVEAGRVDLDASVNMPSGGPVEHAAAKVAMIRHGQRSMYNVDSNDLEWNPYHGQSVEVAHHDIKRRYEEAAKEYR